jgi:hypothetical protein
MAFNEACFDKASLTSRFEEHVRPGVAALFRAFTYARHARVPVWDIAVPISELYESGLRHTEFHWLLACRYVEHAREITHLGADCRRFVPEGRAVFHGETCFVLTQLGAKFAADLLRLQPLDEADADVPHVTSIASAPRPEAVGGPPPCVQPTWDARCRHLHLGGVSIKRFRTPASNQETILAAFQEEGWPERIDDPLPPSPKIMPKRRLHDTINGLNRNQVNRLIHFFGNGQGNGVCWELVADTRD